MPVKQDYENQINAYISSHKEAQTGTMWPIELEGQLKRSPGYKLPINLLRYNVNNGRLAMETLEVQNSLGRPLDSSIPDDAKVIRKQLLELDKNKTDELRKDLIRVGQEQAGVISSDGTLINGNRRMALFQDLHDNLDASGKWDYLEVILLPSSISDSDLWKIEAGLQLSQNKVAEYHPVNELLKIKQGLQAGLKAKQIADVLFGRTLEEVEQGIERLKLIENFLLFFGPGQAGNYGLIKKFGLHEYFINIQKSIMKDADKVGPQEKNKRLQYAFTLIRAHVLAQADKDAELKGLSHFAIRQLGKIFQNNKAYLEFQSVFSDKKVLQEIEPEIIIEGFQSAKEVLELESESFKPKKLLEKALRAIESIDLESIPKGDKEIANLVRKLLNSVNSIHAKVAK